MEISIVPIKTWSFNRNTWGLLSWHFDGYTIKSQSTIYQILYNTAITGQWMCQTHKPRMVINNTMQYKT